MEEKMKRKKNQTTKRALLVASLALCMGMLTGCTFGKPTKESLLKDYVKNMEDLKTADMDMDFNCAFDISQDDMSLAMELSGDADMKYVKEDGDFKAYTNADVKLTLFGISRNTQTENYIIGEDGKVTTYSKLKDEDEWSKTEDTDFTLFGENVDVTQLQEALTLQEETVVEDQTECYVLTGTVTGKDAQTIGSLGLDLDLEDLEMYIALRLSKEEKKPVSITYTVDEESFNKVLKDTLGDELEGAEANIRDFEIVIRFDSINEDMTIEVPDEVFDAKESGNSGFLDGLTPDEEPADDEFSFDLDDDDLFGDDTFDFDDTDTDTDTDDDMDDDFYSLGDDLLSPSDFKAKGYEYKEFIQEGEYRIYDYLYVQNNNKDSRSVSVYATFLKDGEKVGTDLAYLDMEPEAFLIADLSCEEAFDTVEYSFEESEYYGSELIGSELDVFYEINPDGTIAGNVTNESDKAASYPKIHVVFFDEDNNVIEHQYTYAESDILWPGESSDYSMYFDNTGYDSFIFYAEADASDE